MALDIHIVLYQPVIPQNTGSIARLCACTGAVLHLIHPLGFRTDEASVKRAGLDYWEHVRIREHLSWSDFLHAEAPKDIFFFSKFSQTPFSRVTFPHRVFLVFGSETSGLPDAIHSAFSSQMLKIPMRTHLVRSLNLAQSAAIVVYEVLRQHHFDGL